MSYIGDYYFKRVPARVFVRVRVPLCVGVSVFNEERTKAVFSLSTHIAI